MGVSEMRANPRLTPEQMFVSKTVEGELMRAGAEVNLQAIKAARGPAADELIACVDAWADNRPELVERDIVLYLARVFAPDRLKPERSWWQRHARDLRQLFAWVWLVVAIAGIAVTGGALHDVSVLALIGYTVSAVACLVSIVAVGGWADGNTWADRRARGKAKP